MHGANDLLFFFGILFLQLIEVLEQLLHLLMVFRKQRDRVRLLFAGDFCLALSITFSQKCSIESTHCSGDLAIAMPA